MKKITLDQVAFHGVPDIRSAIDNLKKLNIHGDLDDIVSQITITFGELSPRLINQIATSTIYKRHIHKYLMFPSQKEETLNQVKFLIHQVERELNHKILAARRHDTKLRLLKQKGRIISFYKTNAEQLKMLFDLHNLFLKAKEKLTADV